MFQLLNEIFNANKKQVSHDYENENENENQEDVELEKYILTEEENGYFSRTTLSGPISRDINDESEGFDSLKSVECYFPPTELDNVDNLSNEIFGFGANKKVHNMFCSTTRFSYNIHYLVVLCNQPIKRFMD